MFNPRLTIHKLYETLLREQYGPAVFETRVPYAADFKEAIAQRKPIAQYKPKGASAKAIKALADELLARLADAPVHRDDPGGRVMGKLDELMKASRGDRLGVDGRAPGRGRDAPCIGPGRAPMPDRLQGVARSKNAAEIPLDKIDPDPDQPREEFEPEALGRLAESLRARGQLQPIRVRWDEGRALYVIVCGERRWRAAGMAGLTTMSCVIVEGPIYAGRAARRSSSSRTCVREDLQPIEQAKAFRAADGPQRLVDARRRPRAGGRPVERGPGPGAPRPPGGRPGAGGAGRPLAGDRLRGLASSTTPTSRPSSPPASSPRA